jgi:hypothetical protein
MRRTHIAAEAKESDMFAWICLRDGKIGENGESSRDQNFEEKTTLSIRGYRIRSKRKNAFL